MARVRALSCLLGALEGTSSLTHGVRQAVGRFLVELCRPDCRDDDIDEEDDAGGMASQIEMDTSGRHDYVDATNLTADEVTRHLQAMEKARLQQQHVPNEAPNSSSSVSNNDVRDTAMSCLKALLQSRLEMFPTQQSKSPQKDASSPRTEAMAVIRQSMELRMELAMAGVRYRCDAGTDNGDANAINPGAGYEMDLDTGVEEGLSQLPRIKRSLCFNLLEGALDGLKEDTVLWDKLQSQSKEGGTCVLPSSLLKSMAAFASLTSSCLHGETDPRCLLQLLRLLNKGQQVVLPLFREDESTTKSISGMDLGRGGRDIFPSIEIFDAVAPYYPVHFTPPKNDPHGITRVILHDALMAVLCEKGVNYETCEAVVDSGTESGDEIENMITLASRMMLERLDPPKASDYDPPTESNVDDKVDALRDLSTMFLPSDSKPAQQYSVNITRVPSAFLLEMSSSLARVHEEAVSSDNDDQKPLASAVRTFSSALAFSLELSANDTTRLWEAFVVSVTDRLSPTLASAPQGMHGRASTAYLASLAAGSGLATLNKVLSECMPRFLSLLSTLDDDIKGDVIDTGRRKKNRDEEKMSAAMRGIAALMSSCRVATDCWKRDNNGVQVHPHPLSTYTSCIVQRIAGVLGSSAGNHDEGSLSLAAVGALESFFTSVDLSTLTDEEMDSLDIISSVVSSVVLEDIEERMDVDVNRNDTVWKTACARTLGAMIAIGMTLDDGSRLNASAKSLLPQCVTAATTTSSKSTTGVRQRYDWIVLAKACANGTERVSKQIVSELLSGIISWLIENQENSEDSLQLECFPAMVLSYLIRYGGSNVDAAFHCMVPPNTTPLDIVNALCKPLDGRNTDNGMNEEQMVVTRQLPVGMSHLQLPVSRAKEEETANAIVSRLSACEVFC